MCTCMMVYVTWCDHYINDNTLSNICDRFHDSYLHMHTLITMVIVDTYVHPQHHSGELAQMAECLLSMQEVLGLIPRFSNPLQVTLMILMATSNATAFTIVSLLQH